MSRLPSWCRNSIEMRDVVYGDYIVDVDVGVVYIYLRASTVNGKLLVIPKYVFTKLKTPWSLLSTRLKRLFNTYSPLEITSLVEDARVSGCVYSYSPQYGVNVCEIDGVKQGLWCSSRRASIELVSGSYDGRVVDAFVSLFEELGQSIRPTGSLLLLSTHSGSDLDIVVGGYNNVVKVYDELNYLLARGKIARLPDNLVSEWAYREASARDIDPAIVRTLYRPWQRFLFSDTIVSVALVDDSLRSRIDRRIYVVGNKIVRFKARIEGFAPEVLDFPSTVRIVDGNGGYAVLVVFDGVYVPALWEGGVFEVRGVEGILRIGGEDIRAVYVGVRESKHTFIKPV